MTSKPMSPGPHLAQDGVEVGAVVVEQPAGLVDGAGDLSDAAVEDPHGARVGEHDAGGLGTEASRRAARSTSPSAPVGISRTWKPHITAEAGLVPWAASGTRISVRAVSPSGLVIGPDHGHPGELPLGAGGRGQGDRVHPGDLLEHLLQLEHAGQDTLAMGCPAPPGGAPGNPAAWPGCCRPWGCTSWCRSPGDRSGCRWRSSSATGGCSGAPPAAPRPPAGPGGVLRRRCSGIPRRRRVASGAWAWRGGPVWTARISMDQHGGTVSEGRAARRDRPPVGSWRLRAPRGPSRSPAPG